MFVRGYLWGLGAAMSGLAALLGAQLIPTSPPAPVAPPLPPKGCSISGAKLLDPPLGDAAACARFMAAIAPAGAVGAVALKLLPQGVLSVEVTRMHAGRAQHNTFALAVSDRKLAPQDLDRLAGDVISGLAQVTR
jgi:hypothetical protein